MTSHLLFNKLHTQCWGRPCCNTEDLVPSCTPEISFPVINRVGNAIRVPVSPLAVSQVAQHANSQL